MSPHRLLLAAALAACALTPPVLAQGFCPGPDGFSVAGACCTPVVPTLPIFPAITLPSQGNCITDCISGTPFNVNITLSGPAPVFCDTYLMGISIAGTVNVGPSLMLLKYARTWDEVGTPGTIQQVWRFLINGDLTYNGPFTTPCPVPKIAAAGLPVHYVGHVDYARDCSTGAWSAAISLVHLCGDFMHAPWSPQQMTNPNPNIVYAFVGPTPFAWGPVIPPQGALLGDAVRATSYSFLPPTMWQCLSEDGVVGGNLVNAAPYCPCATNPPGAMMWTSQQLNFFYSGCSPVAASFQGLNFPPLAPTGMAAIPLGTWGLAPGSFPGSRRLNTYWGLSFSPDPCTPNGFPIHIVNGVMTSSGDMGIVTPPPPFAPYTSVDFLDLENTLILVGGPPFVAIGYGGLFLASQIWSLNL